MNTPFLSLFFTGEHPTVLGIISITLLVLFISYLLPGNTTKKIKR